MRNTILFITVLSVISAAMIIGVSRIKAAPAQMPIASAAADSLSAPAPQQHVQPSPPPKPAAAVPNIGSVQVWNGCGADGAANRVADFLRSKSFDVKDIGNAPSWNYPATMVISRTADMGLANDIEKALRTGKVALIRNGDAMYDVTVIAGPDFEERIK